MPIEAIIKGWVGESKTKLVQTFFLDAAEYHCFNDLLLNGTHGSTQIDHVIVSKYGVFVIETKNKDGWIYGTSNDENWTQVFFKKKYQFQNPLHQNHLHVKSLEEILRIDHKSIYPIIQFWGKCRFKTKMPENVLRNGLSKYIQSKKIFFFVKMK